MEILKTISKFKRSTLDIHACEKINLFVGVIGLAVFGPDFFFLESAMAGGQRLMS